MKEAGTGSHLQQVFNVRLLSWALDAEQGPSIHLAGPTRLHERDTTCHIMEIGNLIAGTPRTT